jgi:biopolymer transport protein ExbD
VNFRPTRDQEVDINLTPLIDVVFLLLIFFMVSTTFIKESEIDLTLPQASEELREDPVDKIEVSIDREGNVFVNGRALLNAKVGTIRQALADARSDAGDPVVIISADAAATHQGVVDVMDAARQADLYRITFPTRLREQE